jgi:hypothetical protein
MPFSVAVKVSGESGVPYITNPGATELLVITPEVEFTPATVKVPLVGTNTAVLSEAV